MWLFLYRWILVTWFGCKGGYNIVNSKQKGLFFNFSRISLRLVEFLAYIIEQVFMAVKNFARAGNRQTLKNRVKIGVYQYYFLLLQRNRWGGDDDRWTFFSYIIDEECRGPQKSPPFVGLAFCISEACAGRDGNETPRPAYCSKGESAWEHRKTWVWTRARRRQCRRTRQQAGDLPSWLPKTKRR